MWKITTQLNSQLIKDEITKDIRKYFQKNEIKTKHSKIMGKIMGHS